MNPLKKGPDLKMPKFKRGDLKVPGFLSDIYYELSERHLLPLVIVLVVAIVAVPIALSEGGEAEDDAALNGIAGISSAPASKTSQVVVAKTVPGLRDFRKRLAHRSATDPFAEPGVVDKERQVIGEVNDLLQNAVNPETPTETGGEEFSPGGGTTTTTHTITYYSWAMDARVIPVSTNGKPSKAKPTVHNNLPELSPLPGRETPAVIFLGPSKDRDKALMLVSSNVQSIFGDATCVLGGETCEMVALEKGVPETFVYGGNERIFKIELQDLRLIESSKPREAPLGKPGSAPDAAAEVTSTQPR